LEDTSTSTTTTTTKSHSTTGTSKRSLDDTASSGGGGGDGRGGPEDGGSLSNKSDLHSKTANLLEEDSKKDLHAELLSRIQRLMEERIVSVVEEQVSGALEKRMAGVAEQRMKDAGKLDEKLESRITECKDQMDVEKKDFKAELCRAMGNHVESIKQAAANGKDQMDVEKKDFNAELCRAMGNHVESINQAAANGVAEVDRAATSSVQKLSQAAEGHLLALSKAVEVSISKMGRVAEAFKESIKEKSTALVNASLPFLRDPVQAMVETLFTSLSDKTSNHQTIDQPVSRQTSNPVLPLLTSPTPAKRDPETKSESTHVGNEQAKAKRQAPRVTTRGMSNSNSKRRRTSAISPSQETSSENVSRDTTTPVHAKGRPTRRSKHTKQRTGNVKKTTKEPKMERSCVTPTGEMVRRVASPVPMLSLMSSFQKEKQAREEVDLSQSDDSEELLPVKQVVLTCVDELSPLKNPPSRRVQDKSSAISPTPAKKRNLPPQPKKGRSTKRARTYSKAKDWTKSNIQEDSFSFL
jgi:hypothetical protein